MSEHTYAGRRGETLYRFEVSDLAAVESLARMLEEIIGSEDASGLSGVFVHNHRRERGADMLDTWFIYMYHC